MKRLYIIWFLLTFWILGICCSFILENDSPTSQAGTQPANLTKDGIYQNQDFSFHVPDGWQVREGSSDLGKNGWNYYNLNLTILVEAKGKNWVPQAAITNRSIPEGSNMAKVYQDTYRDPLPSINNVTELENVIVDGQTALSRRYNRPWGEPWYSFQDTWVEYKSRIYVIGCQFRLDPKDADRQGCEDIIHSFHFLDSK